MNRIVRAASANRRHCWTGSDVRIAGRRCAASAMSESRSWTICSRKMEANGPSGMMSHDQLRSGLTVNGYALVGCAGSGLAKVSFGRRDAGWGPVTLQADPVHASTPGLIKPLWNQNGCELCLACAARAVAERAVGIDASGVVRARSITEVFGEKVVPIKAACAASRIARNAWAGRGFRHAPTRLAWKCISIVRNKAAWEEGVCLRLSALLRNRVRTFVSVLTPRVGVRIV